MAASDNSNFSGRSTTRQGGFGGTTAPVLPPRGSDTARPGIERPPGSAGPVPGAASPGTPAPSSAPRRNEAEQRTLIVGREIALSGAITSCDRLVVEGSVQANLANCREIDIAESGLFKGSASIDEAEIRGRFEGTLIARKRLHIRATGKVAAAVSYAEIEVEAGGQLSGQIQVLGPDGKEAAAGAPAPGGGPAAGAAPPRDGR
jgi:cytoskeletal protein CcmA (bactofilin family)